MYTSLDLYFHGLRNVHGRNKLVELSWPAPHLHSAPFCSSTDRPRFSTNQEIRVRAWGGGGGAFHWHLFSPGFIPTPTRGSITVSLGLPYL